MVLTGTRVQIPPFPPSVRSTPNGAGNGLLYRPVWVRVPPSTPYVFRIVGIRDRHCGYSQAAGRRVANATRRVRLPLPAPSFSWPRSSVDPERLSPTQKAGGSSPPEAARFLPVAQWIQSARLRTGRPQVQVLPGRPHTQSSCPRGGTGRHSGLRSRRSYEHCRFDSGWGHQFPFCLCGAAGRRSELKIRGLTASAGIVGRMAYSIPARGTKSNKLSGLV